MTEEPGEADRFQLTRFVITCCVADATISYVTVVDAPPGTFETDEWVRVTGPIYPLGSDILVQAESIEPIETARRALPHSVSFEGHAHDAARADQIEAVPNLREPAASREPIDGSIHRGLEVGRDRDVLHRAAVRADQMMMVLGELLGELEPRELTLRDRRDARRRPARAPRGCGRPSSADPFAPGRCRRWTAACSLARGSSTRARAPPCIAGPRAQAIRDRRVQSVELPAASPLRPPRLLIASHPERPRASPADDHEDGGGDQHDRRHPAPSRRSARAPVRRSIRRDPDRDRERRAIAGTSERASCALATGSTIIAATSRMPTICIAATTATAVSTASSAFKTIDREAGDARPFLVGDDREQRPPQHERPPRRCRARARRSPSTSSGRTVSGWPNR